MLAQDYPEYLALYDGYSYGIQRADVMRLFFLHKYGGIYIDLDIECKRSLDFLRHYPWVMPKVRASLAFLPIERLYVTCSSKSGASILPSMASVSSAEAECSILNRQFAFRPRLVCGHAQVVYVSCCTDYAVGIT